MFFVRLFSFGACHLSHLQKFGRLKSSAAEKERVALEATHEELGYRRVRLSQVTHTTYFEDPSYGFQMGLPIVCSCLHQPRTYQRAPGFPKSVRKVEFLAYKKLDIQVLVLVRRHVCAATPRTINSNITVIFIDNLTTTCCCAARQLLI